MTGLCTDPSNTYLFFGDYTDEIIYVNDYSYDAQETEDSNAGSVTAFISNDDSLSAMSGLACDTAEEVLYWFSDDTLYSSDYTGLSNQAITS